MIVYLLRHASAGTHKADPAKDDKRPLDEEGIAQCAAIGHALAALELHLDAILSSPLKRATQTASLVANELGWEGKLELTDAMLPEASFTQFRQLLRAHDDKDAIMVVGHNPSISEFLGRLIVPGAASAAIDVKKGAVAKVESRGKAWELHWLLTPKVARAAQGGRR